MHPKRAPVPGGPREALEAGDPFWAALCAQITREVRDCNIVSGRDLWIVSRPAVNRLRVTALDDPQDSVEAVYDAESHSVACTRGRHARGRPKGLDLSAGRLTVGQAADVILAGLRFPRI